MDKDLLIAERDRLKNGKDIPLFLVGNNSYLCDEVRDFIQWDDEKGCIRIFRKNLSLNNFQLGASVEVMEYGEIQILVARVDEANLDDLMNSLDSSSNPLTDSQKARIKKQLLRTYEDFIKIDG